MTMSDNKTTKWVRPYLIRLKEQVREIPAGSVGTVVEHWADGTAAEVEFYVSLGGELNEHYVETVEFDNMEDAESHE